MDKKSTLEFLKKVKLFKGVSQDDLEKIYSHLKERKAKNGEVIIEERTPGHEVYILLEGKVAVSQSLTLKVGKNTFADKDKSVNSLDCQHFCSFGEIALVDPTSTRTATVTALCDCRFLYIERKDFESLCESDYRLGYILVRNIAEEISARLKKTGNDLLKITTALSISLSR